MCTHTMVKRDTATVFSSIELCFSSSINLLSVAPFPPDSPFVAWNKKPKDEKEMNTCIAQRSRNGG